MSSTLSTVSAAAPTACPNIYQTPITDIHCAMPFGSNHTEIMAACCKDADVVSYYDSCGLYCLAQGQTINELTDCLYAHGARWESVFCNGNQTASATATGRVDIPTGAQATVVASNSAAVESGQGSGARDDAGSDSKPDEGNGAVSFRSPDGIGMLGLAIGALLFSATAIGAFQL